MGICFSKKTAPNGPSPTRAPSSCPATPKALPHQLKTETEEATAPPLPPQQQSQGAAIPPANKHIFRTTPSSINKDQPGGPSTAEALAAATAAAAAEADKMKSMAAATQVASGEQSTQRNGAAAPEQVPQVAATIRTSSCSKEEVESILIQCGRLSRSSSGTEGRHHRSRKRSYDFESSTGRNVDDEEEEREKPPFNRSSPHRQRHRMTSNGDGDNGEHKRSSSRERGSGSGGGRRMSRSPGRRSDTLVASSYSNASSADKLRQPPGKMVLVPTREKTSVPSEVGSGMSVRKAAAPLSAVADGGNKRGNKGGGLRSASPRSRSPANPARSSNENTHSQHLPPQQPQSLSRSSSRKAEQSPYRRNPMAEVDGNIVPRGEQPPPPKPNQIQNDNKMRSSRKADVETKRPPPQSQQQALDSLVSRRSSQRSDETTTQMRGHDVRNGATEVTTGGGNGDTASRSVREQLMSRAKEQRREQQPLAEETADVSMARKGGEVLVLPSTGSGVDVLNLRAALTRTRSSGRSSRYLDANTGFDSDTLLNSNNNNNNNPASYTSFLLEDIHNYHHQQINVAAFSLPACVSKACSILEAVADLNTAAAASSVGSSSKVSEADRSHAKTGHQMAWGGVDAGLSCGI